MSTLTGQYISASYGGVIHLSTNQSISVGTYTRLEDGLGNNLGVLVNGQGFISASVFKGNVQGNVTGNVTGDVTGNLTGNVIGNVVGNLAGTASFANNATSASYARNSTSASYALVAQTLLGTIVSSSYSISSSQAFSASYATVTTNAANAVSASYALVASTAANALLLNGTGSRVFATTGSNTFVGNQSVSGSLTVGTGNVNINTTVYSTGSSYGNIRTLSVSSLTASMDLSTGNLFTLTLVSGFDTHVVPTNIAPGQTISLRVIQAATVPGTISFPSTVTFPTSSYYAATSISSAEDVVTMISFSNTKLNAVASNYFITN
jgi:hypothetical protein